MGRAKKTGIHGLSGKAKRVSKPNASKKEGIHGFKRTPGDTGKSHISGVKEPEKKKPWGGNKRGCMADLLKQVDVRHQIKAARAAKADDADYQPGYDQSDEDDDPAMEEDEYEDDFEDEENPNGAFEKKNSKKDYAVVEQEIRASEDHINLRRRGAQRMEKMADRMFADHGHLEGAKDEELNDVADMTADKFGYFEVSAHDEGTLDVPMRGDGTTVDHFDDFDGLYTKVEKDVHTDRSGNTIKPMEGGWDPAAFPKHTHHDLYVRKFAPPTSKSRGGRTIGEADAAAREEKRRASAIIFKYEPRRLDANRVRRNMTEVEDDDDDDFGASEDQLLVDPEADYKPDESEDLE